MATYTAHPDYVVPTGDFIEQGVGKVDGRLSDL